MKQKYESIIEGLKKSHEKKLEHIQKANADKVNALVKDHDITRAKLTRQINDLSTK